MNHQIVPRETIREKARSHFAAGKRREDHGFNWHAAALPTWLNEYDRLANLARLAKNRSAQREAVTC